ncbi:MAG: hypothetical protein V4719_26515 [Planctomycetota bacterium]
MSNAINSTPNESDLDLKVQLILEEYGVPVLLCNHITGVLDLFLAGTICHLCGCTEDHACVTREGPCTWVRKGLCSGCATWFEFEHELPPLRAVYTDECLAADQDEAIEIFRRDKPGHFIRKINGEPFEDPNRRAKRFKR